MPNRRLLIAAGLLACASVACRQDMHNQPRYKPLAESEFFADHRSARPQVEGTVARGHLRTDLARYTGKAANNLEVDYFPFPITRDDLERGRQRFNIYCSPCHSRLGDGNGMIVKRGFRQPPSYYVDRLKQAPVGHYFDVMTNGFGAMPSYASRVAPDDRWRIIAYIRALQLSGSATLNDVPAEQRPNIQSIPQSGATQPTNAPPANPAAPAKAPAASGAAPNGAAQPTNAAPTLPGQRPASGQGARPTEGRPNQ